LPVVLPLSFFLFYAKRLLLCYANIIAVLVDDIKKAVAAAAILVPISPEAKEQIAWAFQRAAKSGAYEFFVCFLKLFLNDT
jgi:hypothetical protein